MKKKLLSLMMACAMILSLAVPAFAGYFSFESTSGDSLTPDGIVFAAKMHIPTVKLTMPNIVSTSNPVVLNPYKLSYSTSGVDLVNGVAVGEDNDKIKQVISPVYAIKNETNVALKFAVKATTEKNSSADFDFANAHVALSQSLKQAFIQLVIKKTESKTAAASTATNTEQKLDPVDTGKNEVVVIGEGDKSTNNAQFKRLAAIDSTTTTNYLLFQFQGSMTRSPSTGWTTDDTFTTTLEFTFTPEGNQDYNATAKVFVSDTTANYHKALSTAPAALDPAGTLTASPTSGSNFQTFVNAATSATPKQADGTNAVTKISDGNVVNATTPGWSLVSSGGYGATINTSNGQISYPTTVTTLIDGSSAGVDTTDMLIVGFNDKDGVPRTIGVTVTINYKLTTT